MDSRGPGCNNNAVSDRKELSNKAVYVLHYHRSFLNGHNFIQTIKKPSNGSLFQQTLNLFGWKMESAPSEGPTDRSSMYLIPAGSEPDRR